jgi:hypothetical protein
MNRWKLSKTKTTAFDYADGKATVSADGLSVENGFQYNAIFAVYGFPITEHCRRNNFAGTIVYYFEVSNEEGYKE